MKKKMPVMIGVISVFNIVVGAILALSSFGLQSGSDIALLFGTGLFSFVIGIGLVSLRSWARKAAIAGYILNCVVGLAEGNIIAIAVASIILTYLLSEKVRRVYSMDKEQQTTTEKQKDANVILEAPVTTQSIN